MWNERRLSPSYFLLQRISRCDFSRARGIPRGWLTAPPFSVLRGPFGLAGVSRIRARCQRENPKRTQGKRKHARAYFAHTHRTFYTHVHTLYRVPPQSCAFSFQIVNLNQKMFFQLISKRKFFLEERGSAQFKTRVNITYRKLNYCYIKVNFLSLEFLTILRDVYMYYIYTHIYSKKESARFLMLDCTFIRTRTSKSIGDIHAHHKHHPMTRRDDKKSILFLAKNRKCFHTVWIEVASIDIS